MQKLFLIAAISVLPFSEAVAVTSTTYITANVQPQTAVEKVKVELWINTASNPILKTTFGKGGTSFGQIFEVDMLTLSPENLSGYIVCLGSDMRVQFDSRTFVDGQHYTATVTYDAGNPKIGKKPSCDVTWKET